MYVCMCVCVCVSSLIGNKIYQNKKNKIILLIYSSWIFILKRLTNEKQCFSFYFISNNG